MSRALWLVVLVGCVQGEPLPVEAEDLDVTWTGKFEGDGCIDGDVHLDVTVDEDGVFGTYDYVSVNGSHALYEVQGSVADGALVLDQTGMLVADEIGGSYWCYGTMELMLLAEGGVLGGSWVAEDCQCEGSVDMGADEV